MHKAVSRETESSAADGNLFCTPKLNHNKIGFYAGYKD